MLDTIIERIVIYLRKITGGPIVNQISFWIALYFFLNLVAIGAYDIVVMYHMGRTFTVSYVLRTWAYRYPVMLLFIGMLLWHLFGINGVEEITIKQEGPGTPETTIPGPIKPEQ